MNGDQVVATTITDSEGVYEFDDVPPGDYHIQVSKLDPDQQFSPITDGGNQIDPTGASPTANIGYNDTVSTCDIGMYMPPATIGPNEVFGDLDGDGQRDPMEPPLENVTIGLYCLDENGVAVLIGTNVTDAQGQYMNLIMSNLGFVTSRLTRLLMMILVVTMSLVLSMTMGIKFIRMVPRSPRK